RRLGVHASDRVASRYQADRDDPVGIAIGEGPEQDRVDHTEEQAVRPGAERECQHRHDGEAGAPRELAERVAEVLEHATHTATPSTTPHAVTRSACPMTSSRISRRPAPSAIRMPISWVR